VTAGDVRVLILSGHALSRYGLSAALHGQSGIDVVAEADNPTAATELASALRPDVVVLDTVHAGRRAAKIIHLLLDRPASAAPAILVLANKLCDCSPAVILAGAHGLLLKDAEPTDLGGAVRSVASGYMIVPSSLARCLCLPERRPSGSCDPAKLRALSERELEVLHRMVAGKSNAEIASDLHIGEGTVKSHVQHILSKLGVRDRVRAVIYAYDAGFVQGENTGITHLPHSSNLPAVLHKEAS
jgi:DNA-binding NarL/FixJ family response regulator